MTIDQLIPSIWRKRFLSWIEHPLSNRSEIQRLTLYLALIFFIGGIYWSLRRNPELLSNVSVYHIFLVFTAGVPITVLLNALRIKLAARLLKQSMPYHRACEITILSMAANLLPLPGGVLVRIAAFKNTDTNYKQSIIVNLVLALLWTSVVIVFAGGAMLLMRASIITGFIFVCGILLTTCCLILLYRLYGNAPISITLLLLQFGMTGTDAVRLWLCMGAISVASNYLQMAVLTTASVMGSVVSIVPAGLGIREWVAAFLSPIVGIAPEAGFMATSLNRIIGLVSISILAAILIKYRKSIDHD